MDGGECFCETSLGAVAILERGEPQRSVMPDQTAGCLSQPLLWMVEPLFCSRSSTAACSPNRTSGPYACSIHSLRLSRLCLGSCKRAAGPKSSRSAGTRRLWRRNVALCESRPTASQEQVISVTGWREHRLFSPTDAASVTYSGKPRFRGFSIFSRWMEPL